MMSARNGVVMPLAALTGLTAFLFPLAASMVGAFLIAGEAETGTLQDRPRAAGPPRLAADRQVGGRGALPARRPRSSSA